MYFTKAAELLVHSGMNSGWSKAEQDRFSAMLLNSTIPVIYGELGCNGNWELSMIDALVGFAVFTECALHATPLCLRL